MAFPRRVLLTLASGSLLYSGMASALGMGDITLHSALNQPLDAEIELLDVGSLSADQIRIALAPPEAFQAAGVERLAFLQDLRFAPLIQGNSGRIRVVSSNPVREPYLNFLVQISRANSRILREYTVLLDPAPVAASYQSSASPAVVQASVARSAPAPVALPPSSKGATHRVQGGESLWLIARSLSSSGSAGSIAALMRDIQLLNPGAFIGGDPSRLKAGATLLLPDSAAAIAPVPAVPAVEEAAPAPAPAPAPEPQPAAEPVELAALRRELLDELAASREENQRLKDMLLQVQTQMESVQAQLEESRRAAPAQPVAAQPVAAAETVPSPAAVAEPAATLAPEPTTVVQAAAPAPVASPVAPVDAALDGDWWRNGLLVGGLVSLLAALGWSRRRRAQAEQPGEPAPQPMPVAGEAASREQAAPLPAVKPKAVESRAEAAAAPVAAVAAAAVVAPAPAVEPDVLQAAELYLTYGRRDEALGVLLRGIEETPQRTDLRLRALQLLAQAGDQPGFADAAAGYLEQGGASEELAQLLDAYPQMAVAQEQPAATPEPLPTLPASPQSFDNSPATLDELSLDADWDLIGALDAAFDSHPEPLARRDEEAAVIVPPTHFESDLQTLPEVELLDRGNNGRDDETLILGELPDLFDPFDDAPQPSAAEAQADVAQAEAAGEPLAESDQPKPAKPRISLVRSA